MSKRKKACQVLANILQDVFGENLINKYEYYDELGFTSDIETGEIDREMEKLQNEIRYNATAWQYPPQDGWPVDLGIYEVGWRIPGSTEPSAGPILLRTGWNGREFLCCKIENVYAWRLVDDSPPPLTKGD